MIGIFNYYLLKIITWGAIALALYLIYRLIKDRKKADDVTSEECVVISIMVPKNNEKTPLAAEQMFAALHGILHTGATKQVHMSFEIASQDKFTQFYARVPKNIKDFVEGQIYAQYPTVEIQEVQDYTDIDFDGLAIAGTELNLTKKDVYPIKTFPSFEVDPLAGITGLLSKVQGTERVWIQILVSPVDDIWQERGVQLVNAKRKGINTGGNIITDILLHILGIFAAIPGMILSPPKKDAKKEEKKKEEPKLSGPEETAMKGIETKVQKLGFSTKIRILALGEDEVGVKAKLNATVGAFKQFNTTNLNGFVPGNIVTNRDLIPVFQHRPFGDPGPVFNIEELASIYHFPHVSVETPSIVWAGSKKGEPPANLPVEQSIPSEELTCFAMTNFRHMQSKFGLKKIDRRLHTYIIGKTGTGKSNLQKNMIIDDIREGRGLAVVDPHGDLINHVLTFIPEERIKDVVYFNPADSDYPIGFNLLENVDPDLKNIVASGLMSVFTKIWANVWSARMEYILRNCILALLDYPNATFLGIMRLLNDKRYRTKVLEYVKDPVIRDFFINEYEKYDPKFRTEAVAPIQNKVGQFLSSTTIRNIVGQEKSTINMADIMDKGKILLIDLTIGKIGEDNSALLGAMMITKIQLAAMQRANVPEEERRDFYLYVDEFQNFATESFAVILSEARKYHLNLVLANQYIAQIPEVVSAAIFGNVGTIISFRVGAGDAAALVKEFEPVFEANDMVNLDNYHIYIKMAIDGVTCPAFSAVTLPPTEGIYNNIDQVMEFSRRTYGKSREEVEEEIRKSSAEYDDEMEKIEKEEKDKNKKPLMIDDKVFKEISAKGGVKWYFYDRDWDPNELEQEPEQEQEPESELKHEREPEQAEHLISPEEAQEITRGNPQEQVTEQNPAVVHVDELKEGETVTIDK